MKITIITVCFNSERYIRDALDSVLMQTFSDYEYIVIDGNSTDNTLRLVSEYEKKFSGRLRYISEPDKGIYDAMNKGLALASGDITGFLNSDDYYSDARVLERIAGKFEATDASAIYSDLVFVDQIDRTRVTRFYSVPGFKPWWLRFGIMPPHTATFIRRNVFLKFGNFKVDYKIAADYELFVRFFWKQKVKYDYLPGVVIKMRNGGVSNQGLQSKLTLNHEIVRGCQENGLYTNIGLLLLKIPFRLLELIRRPNG